MSDPAELKREILRLTREYSKLVHRSNLPGESRDVPFVGGKDTLPYAGRVFDADEVEAAVSATLDFWLTLGPEGDAFEKELAAFLGIKKSILVNSGSSANLLAFSALTSHKLGDRRILPGDEVITAAAGFPTTVAPIVQNGCVPVFIDVDPLTLNARVDQLDEACTPGKTKAVFMAHTLGNSFDLTAVTDFCRRYNLWLIEDNCDALGSTYDDKLTGTFGDLSSQSFYPPHHLTMGEGGAVNVVREMLQHPRALYGLSDAGAHVGTICDASSTTFLLSHWCRDRQHGSLEAAQLIEMLTHRNARHLGLTDRGRIACGLRADLNLIDPARLAPGVPQLVNDLPSGGKRLLQTSSGYLGTWVRGLPVIRHGEITAHRPGALVRAH